MQYLSCEIRGDCTFHLKQINLYNKKKRKIHHHVQLYHDFMAFLLYNRYKMKMLCLLSNSEVITEGCYFCCGSGQLMMWL